MRRSLFTIRRPVILLLIVLVALPPATALAGRPVKFDSATYAAYGTAWLHLFRALSVAREKPEDTFAHWRRATGMLAVAFEMDPGNPSFGRPLFACYLRLGRPADAARVLKMCPIERDESEDGLIVLAAVPDVSLTVRVYEKVLGDKNLPPERRVPLLRDAAEYCKAKYRYDRALSFYEKAAAAAPRDDRIVLPAVELFRLADKHDLVIKFSRGLVAEHQNLAGPKVADVLKSLAASYLAAKRAEEGTRYFDALQLRAPASAAVCEGRISLRYGMGQTDRALQVAAEFLKQHDSIRVSAVLADMLCDGGNYERAAELLFDVFRRHKFTNKPSPFFVGVVLIAADGLSENGNPDLAAEVLKALLGLPQGLLSSKVRMLVKIELALTYSKAKELHQATRIFHELTTAHPRHPSAYLALAIVHWDSGNRQTAVAVLSGYLKKIPAGSGALEVRARLAGMFDQLGANEKAISLLAENLVENPNHAESCNNLGYLYAVRGINLDVALKLTLKAVRTDPDSAAYLDSFGWTKYKIALRDDNLKSLEEATVALTVAVQRNPKDAVLADHLADVHCVQGKWDQAISGWEQALKAAAAGKGILPNRESVEKKVKTLKQMRLKNKDADRLVRPLKPPPETTPPPRR